MPKIDSRVRVLVSLPSSMRINATLVAHLVTCKFRPKLKAGMTNQEAADAVESALKKYLKCLGGG